MRNTYFMASIIAVFFVLWLGSGQFGDTPPPPAKNVAEENRRLALISEERALTKVQVRTIHASPQNRMITVRGRTMSKRSVVVRAQIGGILAARAVERGDRVVQGDLLCRISIEDREAALKESQEQVSQSLIEFEGSQKLAKQGLQSETSIAQARARLAAANAELRRSELDMARLEIRAPFEGIVEDVHLELGDYVVPGSECITLVDLDPMLLIGNIPESEVSNFKVGLQANALLPTGQSVGGQVAFVAKTADEATRTYPIEVSISNEDYLIPSGVSAQMDISVETVLAQKISPALLSLDDKGNIGVRLVDNRNIVRISRVTIVGDEEDGIWVVGLPNIATVITVGHQLVVAGEEVVPSHGEFHGGSAKGASEAL